MDLDQILITDPEEAAEAANLRYISDNTPGITRRRHGRGFTYLDAKGGRISDPARRERFKALAIPPAWTEVWICPRPNGHIQATGRDEKGRKQYIYLRAVTGQDFTAKDFRTWGGTVEAVRAFYEVGPAESEKQADKNIVQAIKRVSAQLGNTTAVCRHYYVHPAVIEAYRDQSLFAAWDEVTGQSPAEEEEQRLEERVVLLILRRRLAPPAPGAKK